MILADEINRTPPKTQAALLEAMQERQVTVGRVRHALPIRSSCWPRRTPSSRKGTYPLPEAQQDRFMFKVFVKYPSFNEEFEVARRTTTTLHDTIEPVLTAAEILELQRIVREVPVGRPRDPLRPGAGAADARPRAGRARLRRGPDRLGRGTAGRAVPRSSAARPGPCCKAAPTSPATTSRRWPSRCCATAWC